MSVSIHWFRRDLRLTDNTALAAAAAAHEVVVPVYIVSSWKGEHGWCGAPRQEFLCGSLEALSRNLETRDSRLLVRQGRADEVLEKLIRETEADAIYYNRDPDPFGRAMEEKIAAMARRLGVAVHACKDHALHERDEVLTGSGTPFRVFTPYSKAWLRLEKEPAGRIVKRFATPKSLSSDPLPTLKTWGLASSAEILKPGEAAARKRLSRFLDGPVFDYGAKRDLPAEDGTSRLSQDLRHGLLSIREVYGKCVEAGEKATAAQRRGLDTWVNELIWREFYMQVLWFHPEVLEHEMQEQYRTLRWRDRWRPGIREPGRDFLAWTRGETGFPIVDAGMRQLRATGFMHNRVRMIVAMFLTKDLRVWWMHGESWFMRHLVDGEIASNNGGWQWSASTGTDAAPYFRIQNPWSQSKRFDPEGEYIRRWVPELANADAATLCSPPKPGKSAASGYPPPMVDHATAREAVLDLFRAGA